MTQKKTGGMSGTEMGILAAATTAAAGMAAAGYYFYASKDAQKNRKIASKWAGDFKSEVVKQAKRVKDLDQKALLAIVSDAATKYESVKSIDKKDLARAAKELKTNWRELVDELGKGQGAKKVAARITGSPKKTPRAIKSASDKK